MSEDITYCLNKKCPKKKCKRHCSNIKQHDIPHSFAEFDCSTDKGEKTSDSETPWIDDDTLPNEDMRPDNEVI